MEGSRRGFTSSIYLTQVGIEDIFLAQELYLKILLYLFKLGACLSFHFQAKQVSKGLFSNVKVEELLDTKI